MNAGRFAKDPAAQGFAAYAVARGRADAVYSSSTPALTDTSTAKWRGFVADVNKRLKSDGRKAGAFKWAVVAVSRTGDSARLRVCAWNPSTAQRSAKTGKTVEKLPSSWLPATATMISVSGRWKVSAIEGATFSCQDAT